MKPFLDPTDRPLGEPELPSDNQDVDDFLDLQENEIPDDSFAPPKLSTPPSLFFPSQSSTQPPFQCNPPPLSNNDDPIYDIEHILKYYTGKGKKQCLVKWKGFTSKHNSWIPVDSLIEKPDSKTPSSSPPPSRPLDPHTKPMLFLLFVLPTFSHPLFKTPSHIFCS